MAISELQPRFQSPLAPLMEQFVRTKQACGYRFGEGTRILSCFDRYLTAEGLVQCELPRVLVRQWLAKQPHERASTQQCRISLVRQFARYLCRLGYPADVPDRSLSAKASGGFCPRILTHAEVGQLLQAVDQLTPNARAPLRHLIMPEVFRLLYGCGLRANEVLLHAHVVARGTIDRARNRFFLAGRGACLLTDLLSVPKCSCLAEDCQQKRVGLNLRGYRPFQQVVQLVVRQLNDVKLSGGAVALDGDLDFGSHVYVTPEVAHPIYPFAPTMLIA